MKKANVHDLFNLVRFINVLGIKDDFFKAQHESDDLERIGFDAVFGILEKATSTNSEKKFYDILTGPYEMSIDEISNLDFEEFIHNFFECFNMEMLINFIKKASPMTV